MYTTSKSYIYYITLLSIGGSDNLPKGSLSGTTGQRSQYFCLRDIPRAYELAEVIYPVSERVILAKFV